MNGASTIALVRVVADKYREMMKAKVIVMPKAAVLDPQGNAVRDAMRHLGMPEVRSVRIGKYMEIDIKGQNGELERRRDTNYMQKNFAVIQVPRPNCDQDSVANIIDQYGLQAEYVCHEVPSLDGIDILVLAGGFAYGYYRRCGAVARFSPVMKAVI